LRSNTQQGDLFGLSKAPQQACSPAEGELLARLSQGPSATNAQAVLEATLQNVCDSYTRESRATLIAEGIKNTQEIINAFSNALYSGATDIARATVMGESLNQMTPPLSLAEDLLPPKRGSAK
jgi:hypothetical protein